MPADLKSPLEVLYNAFAEVQKPQKIDGCRCCIDDSEVAVLVSKPLREITERELASYAGSALLTVGSEADYRYFLPRILEIKVQVPGWWPDWEVIGRTIASARWDTWTPDQRHAIVQVLDAEFQRALEQAEGSEIDSLLCSLAAAGLDLTPYLARVAAVQSAVLALYGWHANEISAHTLANGFWSDAPKGATQVIAWFHSPEVSLMIMEAYSVELNPPAKEPAL